MFGALAFEHVKQDKLEARPVKCIFIGYANGVKGYKLWKLDPRDSRCFISRDVTFDETGMRMRCKNLEGSKQKA